MTENYENYISRNIKAVYKRKLVAPFIYLLLLVILWLILPLSDLIFPKNLSTHDEIQNYFLEGDSYISTTLSDLYFTGYTNTRLGQTTGYYYYTLMDDNCIFVLLTPDTCEEGLPHINRLRINAKILEPNDAYQELISALSDDLNWTAEGLEGKVTPFILSEPSFRSFLSTLSLFLFFATGFYAFASIVIYILYIVFPVLSPPCQQLARFGSPSKLLAQAEDELETLPQLATEDMFITEHFFIEITRSGIAIVPIQEIIWIYKYSTLHKIFWYHFNISYTLHITTNKHLHIQCPKNIKSNIDGIIDYLSEANHDILVGFSEKNRQKVQEMQTSGLRFERILAFLKRRY